jgi:hypothetical protein
MVVAMGTARADAVPDASLRAVKDRDVRLELDGEPAIEGRVIAFEDASVTIARAGTNEVVTVARAKLVRLIAIDPGAPAAKPPRAVTPDKPRMIGVELGLPGTLTVDAEYKRFYGFASANVLFPMLTASNNAWLAGTVGAGISLPMGGSRWRVDVFGEVMPLNVTGYYTYLAFGIGAGFHYTAPSGFTVAFTFPVAGFSTRLGTSPYGYDATFTYNDSLGYYYLAGVSGMPLVSMGYRFGCRR